MSLRLKMYNQVKKLYEAMDKLEPLEREIISRYYINDESYGKIACSLDIKYDRVIYLKKRGFLKISGYRDLSI